MNIIRLTEKDIHRIVKESVNRVINEVNELPPTNKQVTYLKYLMGKNYKPEYENLPGIEVSKMINKIKTSPSSKQLGYLKYLMGKNYKPEYNNLSRADISRMINQEKERSGLKKDYVVVDTFTNPERRYEFYSIADARRVFNQLIYAYANGGLKTFLLGKNCCFIIGGKYDGSLSTVKLLKNE